MTPLKRALDLVSVAVLTLLLWPLVGLVAAAIWLCDGRPIFYVSERMRSPDRPFALVKFRTMRPDPADYGVSGGDKGARITRTGAFLRRWRLDEMPQLWNVARGDMSFVGPRPPLRRYVEMFPDLYAAVLRSRPGITGLATLACHGRELRLLSATASSAETEAVYVRRCVPVKARLDLIYQRRRTVCFDIWIMIRTVLRPAPIRLFRARTGKQPPPFAKFRRSGGAPGEKRL